MRLITLKLTMDELKLLATLAADQLFRKEFIDSKMPGYKCHPMELSAGKALVQRLQRISSPYSVRSTPLPKTNGATRQAVHAPRQEFIAIPVSGKHKKAHMSARVSFQGA